MAYQYLKALHIIFVVTWFAGMFYMPRLFIYNTEAGEKDEVARTALRQQFSMMMKRLWFGITWPSAILTLIFGLTVMFKGGWNNILFTTEARWLLVKLGFVLLLYVLISWVSGDVVTGWASVMVAILILGSMQLILLGVLGEYLGRLFMESKQRPLYIVQQILRRPRGEFSHQSAERKVDSGPH